MQVYTTAAKQVYWTCPYLVNSGGSDVWTVSASYTYRDELFYRLIRGNIETDWVSASETKNT